MQPVYLPLTDFMNLEFHLMDTRSGVKPEAFVTELVQHWLKVDMERCALRKHGRPMRGFQWKNVFLPEGTCLRTSHKQVIEFAKVYGPLWTFASKDAIELDFRADFIERFRPP